MSPTVGSRPVHSTAAVPAPAAATLLPRVPAAAVVARPVVEPPARAAPVTDSPELAQCEIRLSDWVHGPSGKTPDGQARIAQLTEQIDTIKASIRRGNEAAALASRGSLLNVQA